MTYKECARRCLIGPIATVKQFMEMDLQPSAVNENRAYMCRVNIELPMPNDVGVWITAALGEDGKYYAGVELGTNSQYTVKPMSRRSLKRDSKQALILDIIAEIRDNFPEIPGDRLDDAVNEVFDAIHKQLELDL